MFIQAWSALKEVLAMIFFEQELRKMIAYVPALSDTKYVGQVCFGKLTDILRVRMELVTQSVAKITTRRLRQPSSIEIIDRWIFLRYNLLICLV